jgi:hypothetical protein
MAKKTDEMEGIAYGEATDPQRLSPMCMIDSRPQMLPHFRGFRYEDYEDLRGRSHIHRIS